jgi:hypothetical protein
MVDNRIGDHRGGGCAVGKQHPQTISRKDFGGSHGKILGLEALVISNHELVASFSMIEHIGGKTLRTSPNIVKRVIFGDFTAPAVRPEVD